MGQRSLSAHSEHTTGFPEIFRSSKGSKARSCKDQGYGHVSIQA